MKTIKLIGMVCAVSAALVMTSSKAYAETKSWYEKDNTWYLSNASNEWSKVGDSWYYALSDGRMAVNTVISDDNDLYYVGEDGHMFQNEWKKLSTKHGDKWMFFGDNGRAVKAKTDKAKLIEVNGKDYIFDENGYMLHGWVDEYGDSIGSDEWENGVYYCGGADDGAVSTGWRSIDVDTDDEDYQGHYWFYFGANGKKVTDKYSYNVNGKKYAFDENGVMKHGFQDVYAATPANASKVDTYMYYGEYDDGANARNSWFKTTPSEDIHHDCDEKWFYAGSDGSLKASEIATVKGKKYAFNEYGEMLYGLVGLKTDAENKVILDYTDELLTVYDISKAVEKGYTIYYFHDEDDGHMEKGNVTIELDGEKYRFRFSNSGCVSGDYKGYLYANGYICKADKGERYAMYEKDGDKTTVVGTAMLVDESGRIQKSKTNLKDSDEIYYCTDSNGVVTYRSTSKQ